MAEHTAALAIWARHHGLPAWWAEQMATAVLPWLEQALQQNHHPWVLGIHGSQGSGKSTLAGALCHWAESRGLSAVHLSLDDYYLGRSERAGLADTLHPLLATRGVPGTHASCRLLRDLQALKRGEAGFSLPRFHKQHDDTAPRRQWPHLERPARLVVFEGWCLGLPPQPASELMQPVNALEREQDADGLWRRYVNEQLAGPYRRIWALVDGWLMLAAPGFDCVEAWRWQQEEALRNQLNRQGKPGDRLLSRQQLGRFLQHFQRWTEHGLRILPTRVHLCLSLDRERRVTRVTTGDGRVTEPG